MQDNLQPQDITVRPWKTLSSTMALNEKWMPIRKDKVQLPSGKIVDDYFVWEGPHIVTVVAITSEGRFVLVRQYRHAVGKILHQFPAGAVDKNESPEDAARRELREEAGYDITKPLIHLGTFSQYCTKLSGLDDYFLALDAVAVGQPQYDEQEESEVLTMSEDDLWQLLSKKQLHSVTITTGLLLALRHLRKI